MMQAPDQGVRAFRRALLLAAGVGSLVALVGVLLVPLGAIEHLRGMVDQLCVTASHITSDIAALWLVLLAGTAAIAAVVSVSASIALQRSSHRDWRVVDGEARRRVSRACRDARIATRAVVFRHPQAIACSRGVALPSIWISDSAVSELDEEELAAVLAHEHHHCVRRDPAKRQLLEVLSRALFAFPVVAEATAAFRRTAEFAADDAAARVTNGHATARALLRFASTPHLPVVVQFGAAATIGERVQRLIGADEGRVALSVRARLVSAATGIGALACIAIIAMLPTM